MPLSLVVQSAVLRGVRGRPTSVRVLVPVSPILESHDSEDAIVRAVLSQFGIPHAPYIAEITSDATRSFDSANLAVALALLVAHDKVPATALDDVLVLGHLRMDASIQSVRGTLPTLMGVRNENRPLTVLLPRENLREAQLLPGLILLPADSLGEAIAALCRIDRPLPTVHPQLTIPISSDDPHDVDASKFSPHVLNALEVAAAGNHNILLIGSPGSGTTWLARRLHSLLPPLTPDEALTVTAHCSAAGQLPANVLITERPFRAPHHTVSTTALIGQSYAPGELTLADRGVLLLDQLNEFRFNTLDSIASVVLAKRVTIQRGIGDWVTMPASSLVAATMTVCPCGWLGHPDALCGCTPPQIAHHRMRIPPQCMSLFDLVVHLTPTRHVVCDLRPSEPWSERLHRIAEARARRALRPENHAFRMTDAAVELLNAALATWPDDPTHPDRILEIASTIADLASTDMISENAIEQALCYRMPASNDPLKITAT